MLPSSDQKYKSNLKDRSFETKTPTDLDREYALRVPKIIFACTKKKRNIIRIKFVQKINEDDLDHRMQFCEVIQNVCHQIPRFIRQIVFLLLKQPSV